MGRGSSGRISSVSRYRTQATEAQEKTLKNIIAKTAKLKNEQYRIIDKDGNVVLKKQGTEHEVMSLVGEKRDNLPGALSIHNHPNGGPPSLADLSEFGYGATQIVIATPEGVYRLINNRVGTPTQYNGWYDMREAMQNTIKEPESSLTYRKRAEAKLKKSRELQMMNKISQQFMNDKKAGVPQSHLDKLWERYQKYESKYKERLKVETRREEVKPFHDFYKKNAKKYGFTYVAPKYW